MTDRVYPSSKANGTTATTAAAATTTAATTTANPRLPPTKSQLYNPNRHPYRPQPNNRHSRRRGGRRCFCLCCFWSFLFLILLLLLAAIAGCVVYVLYRPHRPTFSISSLRISQFNLTTAADDGSTRLTSKLNLTISSKNPNKKIIFYYDSISITSFSDQVQIANGSFQSFTSNPNNITIIRSPLYSSSEFVEPDPARKLKSDLKRKSGLPLKIVLETDARVKVDSLKRSKKVGIKITCDGIHGMVPKGNSSSPAAISDAKCKVDLQIKIWRWTF